MEQYEQDSCLLVKDFFPFISVSAFSLLTNTTYTGRKLVCYFLGITFLEFHLVDPFLCEAFNGFALIY